MKAIAITPKQKGSLRVQEQDVPKPKSKELLLEVQRVGICGTDRDIISGFYGEAPRGEKYLVLGHESLSRVAGMGDRVSGFKKHDLVVPTVRRNCTQNCLNCRSGESDMCLTGHYVEHGIKGIHGFAREYAVSDSSFVVKLPESLSDVGVLLEPLSISEKGLAQTMLLQNARMKWKPRNALVLGAGPVGLLATGLLRLRGFEVKTVATRPPESQKAKMVRETGAEYIDSTKTPLNTLDGKFDMVFEVTGSTQVAVEAQSLPSTNGVLCLLGVYKEEVEQENAGKLFTSEVLGNKVLFGCVNANRSYFLQGVKDLQTMNKRWPGFLEKMITRRVSLGDLSAYTPESHEEIKTIIEVKK